MTDAAKLLIALAGLGILGLLFALAAAKLDDHEPERPGDDGQWKRWREQLRDDIEGESR